MDKLSALSEIGNRIKERRESLGMTQEELALALGYKSRTSINKIEKGLTDIPQSRIVSFAEVLKTTPGYIMGYDTSQNIDDTIKFALFGGADGITDEQLEEVKRFSEFIKEKNKEKNKD